MTMTTDKANGLIVTSAAIAGTLLVVKDATAGKPPAIRSFVGLGFASLGLAVLAESAPNIAGGMAVLILLTSVFVYGGPAYTAITKATAPPPTTPKK